MVKSMRWKMLSAIMVLGVFLLSAGMVSATSFSFTAHDPSDVSNADYDITSFGANVNGDTVILWIQVRGNINTHPPTGYRNGYNMNIESGEYQITVSAMWTTDENGQTQATVYYVTSSSFDELSPGEYVISGNRIEFHLDSALFNDVGDEYTVTASTDLLNLNGPTTGTGLDYAEYSTSSSSTSGGDSGGSSNSGFPMGLLLWILIPLIIVIVVIVLVVILVVHKSTAPKQPPLQQPPPPPPSTEDGNNYYE